MLYLIRNISKQSRIFCCDPINMIDDEYIIKTYIGSTAQFLLLFIFDQMLRIYFVDIKSKLNNRLTLIPSYFEQIVQLSFRRLKQLQAYSLHSLSNEACLDISIIIDQPTSYRLLFYSRYQFYCLSRQMDILAHLRRMYYFPKMCFSKIRYFRMTKSIFLYLFVSNIIDQNTDIRSSIKCVSQTLESILPSSVPNLI